jgi:hypothetical protein
MLDLLAGAVGGLLGGAAPSGTGASGSGTDASTGAPGNTTSSDARSSLKVANKSKSGGARLTIQGSGPGAGGAANPLEESGIPAWLIVVAVLSLVALVVLALVLGG